VAWQTYYTADNTFATPEFPLRLWHEAPHQGDIPMHQHEYSELNIVLGGSALHVTERDQYRLQAGDVYVVHQDMQHGVRAPQEFDFFVIAFDPARVLLGQERLREISGYHALFVLEPHYRQRHQHRRHLRLSAAQLRHTAALCASLEREYRRTSNGRELLVTLLFSQLVAYLCLCHGETVPRSQPTMLRLAPVISYIEQQLGAPLSTRQLARMAHQSVNQFIRVFHDATGYTPMKYVARQRVLRAAELLEHSVLSCKEIAARCGFDSTNYFSRTFVQLMGQRPTVYRARRLARQ